MIVRLEDYSHRTERAGAVVHDEMLDVYGRVHRSSVGATQLFIVSDSAKGPHYLLPSNKHTLYSHCSIKLPLL